MIAAELNVAVQFMAAAKYDKMIPADKAKVCTAYFAMSDEVDKLAKLQQEGVQKLVTERQKELEKKEGRTAAEDAELDTLKKEFDEAVNLLLFEDGEREVRPKFDRLSEEAFEKLADGSSLNFAATRILHRVLVEEESES